MADITGRSALIAAVPLLDARPGAAIRRALSRRRSPCHTHFILPSFAGGWPATLVAPTRAGAWMTPTYTSAISVERRLQRQLLRQLQPYLRRRRLHLQPRPRCPHRVLHQRQQLRLRLLRGLYQNQGLARLQRLGRRRSSLAARPHSFCQRVEDNAFHPRRECHGGSASPKTMEEVSAKAQAKTKQATILG
jgi:hypothetical protein